MAKQGKTGLVHYYPGRGKGKTTAALGLALRAAGHGLKTCFIQFLKISNRYGELAAVKKLGGLIEIRQFGSPCRNPGAADPGFVCAGCMACHVNPDDPRPEDIECAKKALEFAAASLESGAYGLVVCDEIGYAVELGLISPADVAGMLKKRNPQTEAVLTGGALYDEIAALCDYVTEISEIKHHYRSGLVEVKGIDY
jgi:cob(I)alamin adenosyltransferase